MVFQRRKFLELLNLFLKDGDLAVVCFLQVLDLEVSAGEQFVAQMVDLGLACVFAALDV